MQQGKFYWEEIILNQYLGFLYYSSTDSLIVISVCIADSIIEPDTK